MPKTINNKRNNPYFLDVSEYIITQAYQQQMTPKIIPTSHQINQIKTPHNLPFMIELQGCHPSPYLKQLLQNQQIQFYDFTLQGPQQQDFDQNQANYLDDDVIMQDQQQNQKSNSQQNLQYVDQITYVEPSRLNLKTFRAILQEFKNIKLSDEQIRQFVEEYLTEEDLQKVKGKNNQQLIQIAQFNLRPCGVISWLQRRNKVSKYLQKKKRRIWNKKINYDCRKKVAQNRLRIKGKFVTQQQACQLLGLRETSTIDQIKILLEQKYKG